MKLLNKLIAKQAKEITDIRLSYTTNYEFILTKFAYFRKSWMIPPG